MSGKYSVFRCGITRLFKEKADMYSLHVYERLPVFQTAEVNYRMQA